MTVQSPKKGFLRLAFERVIDARQQTADRLVARHAGLLEKDHGRIL